MTSIAANSANKQLADFGSVQKKRSSRPQTAVKKEDIEDSRSDASYISYATSSNFSSVLKRPQVTSFHPSGVPPAGDLSAVTSSFQSQISYEDGFPNAEFNAVTEEERARRRKEEKDQKMKEFMERTKHSAKEKLR